MKLIKEHINEKFEEDSDPIHDLGIGNNDVIIQDIIQPILDEYKKEGSNDIVAQRKYFKKIKDIISPIIVGRYVKGSVWEIGGGRWKHGGFTIKVTKILSQGTIFKDTRSHGSLYFTVAASNGKRYCLYIAIKYFISSQPTGKIYEKFEEESDPIKDMNIGLYEFWREKHNEIGNTSPSVTYEKYFKEKYIYNSDYSHCVYLLWDTLRYLSEKMDPHEAFNKAAHMGRSIEEKRKTAIVLKKHFFVDVMVKNVNEKFEQDSDPVEDMRIGTKWKEKLALKFLDWVDKDFQMDHNSSDYWGYINVSIIGLRDEDLREGFIEYVKNWPKYRKVLKELNIKISGIPDILETIFERPEDYDSTK